MTLGIRVTMGHEDVRGKRSDNLLCVIRSLFWVYRACVCLLGVVTDGRLPRGQRGGRTSSGVAGSAEGG